MSVNQLREREGLEPLPARITGNGTTQPRGVFTAVAGVRYAELMNFAVKQFQTTITRRFEQATCRLAFEAYHSALQEVWTTPMKTAADNRTLHESELMEARRDPCEFLENTSPGEIRENAAKILDRVILGRKSFAICSYEGAMMGQRPVTHAVIMPADEYRRLLIDRERLSRLAGELVAISNGKS
ncbi:hypothetical protein [Singulisphaera sp. PoT]|uniref:hypothetical protein n=1 Tax=Singulisphaera sp. PoT TaxID=3411797 RepID=UPI003BF59000